MWQTARLAPQHQASVQYVVTNILRLQPTCARVVWRIARHVQQVIIVKYARMVILEVPTKAVLARWRVEVQCSVWQVLSPLPLGCLPLFSERPSCRMLVNVVWAIRTSYGKYIGISGNSNGSYVTFTSPWFCPLCQGNCCKSADSRSEFLCRSHGILCEWHDCSSCRSSIFVTSHESLIACTSASTDLQSYHIGVLNLPWGPMSLRDLTQHCRRTDISYEDRTKSKFWSPVFQPNCLKADMRMGMRMLCLFLLTDASIT